MEPTTERIISVPNSFGILANLRFTVGSFRDGAQHVASFSKFNLETLLARHGFELKELYTAYDRPPNGLRGRMKFAAGIPIFKIRQKNSWVTSGSGSLPSEW